MKSFLELYEEIEKTHNPVVMAFGRMNPPTTGHLKLIHKIREVAEKNHAPHHIIVSHSQDTKKNPLSAKQKIKHLRRYSPGTNFESSSSEEPSIFHHATRLYNKGHDHLIVVAGSDRVKEFQTTLDKYNDVKGKHGFYKFKKISVVSAGHRDPDAEGAEGMSATKMREHAKNNNFAGFREGVPSHVSDEHTKELMHDVRKGMGLNEQIYRGSFKAIFLTGGPGSGKDIIIREAIAESKMTEINFTQAIDFLGDKQKLSEKTNDYRRESIRRRSPLIINGPADDYEKVSYIKEELEELGYETMMIFVGTTNEISKQRNESLSKMMNESARYHKWNKSQKNINSFYEIFETFIGFDNTGNLDTKEEDIHTVYENTNLFLDSNRFTDVAEGWLKRNRGVLTESKPILRALPLPKEPNFNYDNDKKKRLKGGDTSGKEPKSVRPTGLGGEWNTRTNGSGLTGGAGLGGMGETVEYSNASPASNAMPGGGSVNPLSSDYDVPKKKKLRTFKEYNGFQNDVESGLGGVLGGASNKEGMDTYKDLNRNVGVIIKKKGKKKFNEDCVVELEKGLQKLDSHSYDSIDSLMKKIAVKHGITGKDLHNDFKKKHGKIPDDWIKGKK